MTKIDIISGFLGAGKTTLIKKLIKEAFNSEKIVIIENEFGDIGIDGGFLKDSGIEITEMNSGCICCSLVGDFGKALNEVLEKYSPERIIIEPSGVGKLSDVIAAVQKIDNNNAKLNSFSVIVDAKKCKMYMKNFGEFFNNQVENAGTIVLSHTTGMDDEKLKGVVSLLREHNDKAEIVTTEWELITGSQILASIEHSKTLEDEIAELEEEHRHHHEHDEGCTCGCHHHHDEDEHEHHHHDEDEHEHHHHHEDESEHDEECSCGCHHHHDDEHEHHHHDEDEHEHYHHHEDESEHDEECSCGCHHHHDDEHEHHHHHHADDVFASWGKETTKKFSEDDIRNALNDLINEEKYGIILRAKGIVAGDGVWYHFDYTPGEPDIRTGIADTIGRLCVIGSKINEEAISALFE